MSLKAPQRVGWHWFLPDAHCTRFLPDAHCDTPTEILRMDRPVVLLVGVDKFTRDMPPARFVVRFSEMMLYCDDMSGDWEPIEPPSRMRKMAFDRVVRRLQQ